MLNDMVETGNVTMMSTIIQCKLRKTIVLMLKFIMISSFLYRLNTRLEVKAKQKKKLVLRPLFFKSDEAGRFFFFFFFLFSI